MSTETALTPTLQRAFPQPLLPLNFRNWQYVWLRNFMVWRKLAIPSMAGNLADPMIYLFGLGLGLGLLVGRVDGVSYIAFLAAGTVASSTMMSASFEAMYSAFSRMHVQRTWEAILYAPLSLGDVVLGELFWAASKSVLSGLAIMLVAGALGYASMPQALLALPVINGGEKMVGIVTVDDAMDIEKQEDATQLARFGGTVTTDGTDLDLLESPFRKMFSVRVFWLVLLTLFGVVTSTFVAAQEEILSQVIVLAAFIAPIVDMGGNAGSQSATLVIRAMALGDVSLRWQDVWRVVRRELPVAAALGLVVAAMETVLAWFSKGIDLDVLLVVGLSMLVCTVLGGIIGVLLPFVARRIGTDPATLSSPLITSIMDLVGVFIYFAFAYAFLGDLLQQAG